MLMKNRKFYYQLAGMLVITVFAVGFSQTDILRHGAASLFHAGEDFFFKEGLRVRGREIVDRIVDLDAHVVLTLAETEGADELDLVLQMIFLDEPLKVLDDLARAFQMARGANADGQFHVAFSFSFSVEGVSAAARCCESTASEAAIFSFLSKTPSGTVRCAGAKFQIARIPAAQRTSHTCCAASAGTGPVRFSAALRGGALELEASGPEARRHARPDPLTTELLRRYGGRFSAKTEDGTLRLLIHLPDRAPTPA